MNIVQPSFEFKAVGFDLDGTIIPSYKALAALHDTIKDHGHDPNAFAESHRDKVPFQHLLHGSGFVRKLLSDWNGSHAEVTRPIPADAIDIELRAKQREAYKAYPGAAETLKRAHDAGAVTFIFTNSVDGYTLQRLQHSGIDPDEVDIVFAKDGSHLKAEMRMPSDSPWAKKLVAYKDCEFTKPSDIPLRKIGELADIPPQNILFGGEGRNDLNCVYRDPRNPAAVFAFQEHGALDITGSQVTMNALLRPGQEPLGIEPVHKRMSELRKERPGIDSEIIRLKNGFPDLIKMLDSGNITFSSANYPVAVENNKLKRVEPKEVGGYYPQPAFELGYAS